jgi:hypothetical protein
MTAALLSAGLVAGCTAQDAQDVDEQATAEDGTAPAGGGTASPPEDSRAGTGAPAAPATSTRSAPAASTSKPAAQPEYRDMQIAAGTALPLELQTALASETATVEMPVRARLTQAIGVDGATLLPAGTQLDGTVTDVQQSGRVKGRARVSLVFTQAVIDGVRHDLTTDPVTFEAQGTRGEDATKIGVGAGIGAAIGGILGGGSGAATGAAIGGAAGTGAVLATKGEHVEVAEGTALAATLADPFTMRVRVR